MESVTIGGLSCVLVFRCGGSANTAKKKLSVMYSVLTEICCGQFHFVNAVLWVKKTL